MSIERLDALEAVAVRAIQATYDVAQKDTTARFWIQKGIEGMRLAVAEEKTQEAPETPHDIADRWVADIRASMKLLQQQHANAWEEVDRLHGELTAAREVAERALEYGALALYEDDVTDLFKVLGMEV